MSAESGPQGSEHKSASQLRIEAHSLAHPRHPDRNEDAMIRIEKLNTYALFDGIGGHNDGRVASQMGIKTFGDEIERNLSRTSTLTEAQDAMRKALLASNEAVYKENEPFSDPKEQMGSTAVACHIWEGKGERKAVIGHVGDSRAYLFRNGKIEQLTLDDSVLASQYRDNLDEARRVQKQFSEVLNSKDSSQLPADLKYIYDISNFVTQSIGRKNIKPHITTVDLMPGDKVILLSDGVPDNLTDSELEEILKAQADTAKVVSEITGHAKNISVSPDDPKRDRKKPDDISVMIADIPLKGPKKDIVQPPKVVPVPVVPLTPPPEPPKRMPAPIVTGGTDVVDADPTKDLPWNLPPELEANENIKGALDLFEEGYRLMMQKPEGELTSDEKAIRAQLQQTVNKIKEQGKGLYFVNNLTYTDPFDPSIKKRYSIREYLPTDEIIDFLSSEIQSGNLTEAERTHYEQLHANLFLNSKSYSERILRPKESLKHIARVTQERAAIDAVGLGTPESRLHLAGTRINKRRELRITSRSKLKTATRLGSGAGPAPIVPPIVVPPPAPIVPPIIPIPVVPPVAPIVPVVPSVVVSPLPLEASVVVSEEPLEEEPLVPPTIAEMRYEMHVVNRTEDIYKRAREIAEEQLRAEMKKGKWYNPKDWFRKAKTRVFEEYYRQQYTQRAVEAMLHNNNSYLQMDVVKNAAVQATHKVEEERKAGVAKAMTAGEMLRLQQEGHMTFEGQKVEEAVSEASRTLFVNNLLRSAVSNLNGLTTADLDQVSDMNNVRRGQITGSLQETMRKWVAATYDPAVMATLPADVQAALGDAQVRDQIKNLFGQDATRYGVKAEYFASDIVELAQKMERDRRAHSFALDQMLAQSKVVLANMSWAAETQARFNNADKVIAWAQRHRAAGVILNPATVGAAVSVGSYFALKAPTAVGKMAHIVAPGIGGIAGGTVAAFRRSMDLKVDRASHQVERTYGAERVTHEDVDHQLERLNWVQKRLAVAAGAYRRADLENFAYDIRPSRELTDSVVRSSATDLSVDTNRQALAKNIGEIKARLDFSSAEKVDMVTYEGREQVEQSRLELIKSLAQAKIALRNAVGGNEAEAERLITAARNEQYQQFITNRKDSDRAFRNYRVRESLKAGARGAATGFGVAMAGEGVVWGANRVIEHINQSDTQDIVTILGHKPTPAEFVSAVKDDNYISKPDLQQLYTDPKPHMVNLTDELAMKIQPNHEVRFVNNDIGFTHYDVEAAHLNPDGSLSLNGPLTDEIKTQLKEAHFNIQEQTATSMVEAPASVHGDLTTGFRTDIPDGTEWVKDVHGWDLVVSTDHSKVLVNDAVFSSQGVIEHWDTAGSMLHTINEGSYEHAVREVLNARGEWKEGVKLDRYEWYSYNQPGSQLNELKLYNYKMGDTVRLSMHNMGDSWQRGLNPERINVPSVYEGMDIQGGKAGFAFSLPGHLKEPIIALTDKDGYLDLNPNDHDPSHLMFYVDPKGEVKSMPLGDFSRMVVNYDAYKDLPDGGLATELRGRYDVWKVGGPNGEFGFISAGRYVEQNGQQVWQSFATIRGTDTPDITESTELIVTPPRIDTTFIEHGIKTTNIYPPDEIELPPVAIPFVPRFPLEPIETPEIFRMPVYAYMETSQAQNFQYESRRSPRLNENPRRVLNPNEEIRWYLNQQTNEYRTELEEMNNRITEPMHDECRLAVCIAAAAHQEGRNIYHTLLQYVEQQDSNGNPMSPDKYEIILFLNRPITSAPDSTRDEVKRFMREHPEVKVRLMEKEFPVRQNMGVISKYVADIALLRTLNRQHPSSSDVILVTNDADADAISNKYINAIISHYDNPSNANMEGALGKIEWNPESYIKYPGFHVANRFYQYLESGRRHGVGGMRSIGSSGANFSLKSSIYAAIGGYVTQSDLAQDVELSRMILASRQPRGQNYSRDNYPIGFINPAWIVTNPRRGLHAYKEGRPVVHQWDDWSTNQGEVRTIDWRSSAVVNETIDTMDKLHIQNDINAAIQVYGMTTRNQLVKKSMNMLHLHTIEECQTRVDNLIDRGLSPNSTEVQTLIKELGVAQYRIDGNRIIVEKAGYHVEEDQIVVDDIRSLQEALRKYQTENRDQIHIFKNTN